MMVARQVITQRGGAPAHGPADERSLPERLAAAKAMLRACRLCEHRCGVDRTAGEKAPCRLGGETYEYKRYISLNEEAELLPALRLFWGGCNFRCRFCDEAPDAFKPVVGRPIEPRVCAAELADALEAGCKTISILGGEPTLHVHTILALAAVAPRPLPLALNTNMYMTPEVLELLAGVVSVYLADFKFGNDACARALAGVPRYFDVIRRNIERAATVTSVIIRHVLIPGHLNCCFYPIVDWVAQNLPGIRFQLYTGYVPCGPAADDPVIGRLNSRGEEREAREYLAATNLNTGTGPTCRERFASPGRQLSQRGSATVTLGADGRLYCHDLATGLVDVLTALCSDRPQSRAPASASGEQLGIRP
jgi:putative pyruvate formate lyase activating enzyme